MKKVTVALSEKVYSKIKSNLARVAIPETEIPAKITESAVDLAEMELTCFLETHTYPDRQTAVRATEKLFKEYTGDPDYRLSYRHNGKIVTEDLSNPYWVESRSSSDPTRCAPYVRFTQQQFEVIEMTAQALRATPEDLIRACALAFLDEEIVRIGEINAALVAFTVENRKPRADTEGINPFVFGERVA